MKRKKMLVMATVFAMLFGLAQVAGASLVIPIPNHFTSTSTESHTITINSDWGGLTNGWYFGIYDFDATNPTPSAGLDLLLGSNITPFNSANFSVTYDNSDYWITVISGDFTSQAPLNIGGSDDFSFYFRNNDGSIYDTGPWIIGGNLNYGFVSYRYGLGGAVIGADLNPVPLPGSAIFLFSGIMGLVAFGSRRKIMK